VRDEAAELALPFLMNEWKPHPVSPMEQILEFIRSQFVPTSAGSHQSQFLVGGKGDKL
jgi:hypothetical protein